MTKALLLKTGKLLKKDDYLSAKEVLDKIDLAKLTPCQKIDWLLLKGKIKLGLGFPDKALPLADEALKKSIELRENEKLVDSYILKMKAMISLNQNEKFQLVYSVAERSLGDLKPKSSPKYIERQAQLLLLKGRFFDKIGANKDALELFKRAKRLFEQFDLNKELAITNLLITYIFRLQGNLEKALTILNETLHMAEKTQSREILSRVLNGLGVIYWLKGEHKQALEYYDRALEIAGEMGNKRVYARYYNNSGIVYYFLGNYNLALEYYEKALMNLTPVRDERMISTVNHNIAQIYRWQGKLDKALEKMIAGLRAAQKDGRLITIIAFMNGIGKVYQLKGDFEQALIHLQLAYQLKDKTTNNIPISRTLYYLVAICIDTNELQLARDYLKELEVLAEKEKNKLITQRAKISEALLLKLETRSRSRVRAEELFNEVINGEIIDSELFIDALLNLTEMLLLELKMTGNEELLHEVKELITKLLEIAEKQNLISLLAEVYWLQSQIALLEFDLDKSRQLLSQAENLAAELGFNRLGYRISRQHDELLEKIENWEFLLKQNAPLIERMDAIKLDEFLMELFKQRAFDIPPLPSEEPIMLLILRESGAPIFSKNFTANKKSFDDALISGFLTAINSFLAEALKSKGTIERIKHNEYNMIIRSFDSLSLCYIFKGQSFSAMQHVNKIINYMQKDPHLWKELSSNIDSSKPLTKQNLALLNKIINNVFLSTHS